MRLLKRQEAVNNSSVCLPSFPEPETHLEAVGADKEFVLVSGGFAIVQPGSKLSINAVEGYALEDFSSEVC